ncbi:MAG: iron transporter FeoB [Paenibacillaceae bacterium]|jgi:Fe2+ transport system protein B|nr:iron transporter FeoB [Paenibacillaceae bacterium]
MSGYSVALAGNPNTGKSTLFNLLTGLRQHTGNWAGKTVSLAEGEYTFKEASYRIIDLPGTYSLYSNSADEEVARDYIIFEQPDVTIVVLDATSLERNLNLALQVLEMTNRVVVCINLIDEAKRLGIQIDVPKLEQKLGVPTVAVSARSELNIDALLEQVEAVATGRINPVPLLVDYGEEIEEKLKLLAPSIEKTLGDRFPVRWVALRLLDEDLSLFESLKKRMNGEPSLPRKGGASHGRPACHELA